MCLPRIQQGRAEELRELGERHRDAGGAVYLVSLTMPHDEGDHLRPLRKHVAKAWRAMLQGAPWAKWERRLGMLGHVRAMEVTHGPNGWHPHLHVGVYMRRRVPARVLVEFRRWLRARWEQRITRPTDSGRRYRPPAWPHGVRLTEARSATYLTKMGLVRELVSSSTKAGRLGHRTYLQILRDLTLTTDAERRRRDMKLWREWARAMRGAKQLTYSPGLRNWQAVYGVLAREDEELPDLQGDLELTYPGTADAIIVYEFGREEWETVLASPRSVALRLLLLRVPGEYPPSEWTDQIGLLVQLDWWRIAPLEIAA